MLSRTAIDAKELLDRHLQLAQGAAACIGGAFGISAAAENAALASYVPDNNRSQLVQRGNLSLLLDAYNANPSSMEAAVVNAAALEAAEKLLVLGDMIELGVTVLDTPVFFCGTK